MDKLPPETIIKIAEYLSSDDLVSLSGANKSIFATIANDKLLWQHQLRYGKFHTCNELKKLIPKDSVNCQEKDEFLLQKRLQQNWKTANFQITHTTQPLARRNFSLGCKYDDFVLWYAKSGTNTWHLFWFDVDTGFQSATFSYPVDTSERLWSVHYWKSDREWSDYLAWNMKVMNETIFIMRTTAADDLTSIDLYDAKSGKHVEKFRHALFSNGCADLFGDESQKRRGISERCDYIPIAWINYEDFKIRLMSLNVNNLDLKLLKTIDFGHAYKQSGERLSYINCDRNRQWSVEVLNLANSQIDRSIKSGGRLLCYDFTSNESLYALEETTENNIQYFLHYYGPEEKKCEVTTTAWELREVHRECLIAINNRDQGTRASISINSFNTNGEVATETQRPLPHTYTTREDLDFNVLELELLTSVALAKFENKVGSNFWMVLDFKPC